MHALILARKHKTQQSIAKAPRPKVAMSEASMSEASKSQQQGMVLIVALVMLLILTLIGVAVMESSVLEERMAGNNLAHNIAFQVAEASLRAGEARVASFSNRPEPINGVVSASVSILDTIPPATPNWWAGKDEAWWTTNGTEYDQSFAGTNEHPRYIIEEYDEVCDGAIDPTIRQCKIIYRVTGIAWGGRNTSVLLQSLFARRY